MTTSSTITPALLFTITPMPLSIIPTTTSLNIITHIFNNITILMPIMATNLIIRPSLSRRILTWSLSHNLSTAHWAKLHPLPIHALLRS